MTELDDIPSEKPKIKHDDEHDILIIPRLGNRQMRLKLPQGSSALVNNYTTLDTRERKLMEALATIQETLLSVRETRRSMMYELMGMAQEVVEEENSNALAEAKRLAEEEVEEMKDKKKSQQMSDARSTD